MTVVPLDHLPVIPYPILACPSVVSKIESAIQLIHVSTAPDDKPNEEWKIAQTIQKNLLHTIPVTVITTLLLLPIWIVLTKESMTYMPKILFPTCIELNE